MNDFSAKRQEGVQFYLVCRHSSVDDKTEEVDVEGAQKSETMANRVLAKIPEECRDSPRKVLMIVSAKVRTRQSARALANMLKVTPVEIGYLLGSEQTIVLAPKVAEIIRAQLTPETRVVIVFGHNPQVQRLPKELAPNICYQVMEALLPGEAYFIDVTARTWERLRVEE